MTDFQGLVAVVTGGAGGIGGQPRVCSKCAVRVSRSWTAVRTVHPMVCWPCAATSRIPQPSTPRSRQPEQRRAEWARVLDVNVTGIARVIRAALPHLRRSPHASVVNTCSAVAFMWTSFPWPSYPRAFVGNHVGIPRVCRWACKSRQRSPAKHCVWPISRPSPECHDPTRRRRLNRP